MRPIMSIFSNGHVKNFKSQPSSSCWRRAPILNARGFQIPLWCTSQRSFARIAYMWVTSRSNTCPPFGFYFNIPRTGKRSGPQQRLKPKNHTIARLYKAYLAWISRITKSRYCLRKIQYIRGQGLAQMSTFQRLTDLHRSRRLRRSSSTSTYKDGMPLD